MPLPEINKIEGKYKFLKRNNEYYLGYKTNIDIEHLDTLNIPEKYKHDKIILEKSGRTLTSPKTTEVLYRASLKFTFLDKDRFKVIEIVSEPISIRSGQNNEFQDIVENSISRDIIKITDAIKLYLSIERCVTCEE